jgi:hypothetical protein
MNSCGWLALKTLRPHKNAKYGTRLLNSPVTNNDNPFAIIRFSAVLFYLFLATNAYSDEATNPPVDQVIFLKQSISSPPDVEMFVAGQRILQPPYLPPSFEPIQWSTKTQYFEGARSGTNFYIRAVEYPDSANLVQIGSRTGRAGDFIYSIGKNEISRGIGSNAMSGDINAQFVLINQFLNVGANDIKPDSVVWNGNSFTAKSNRGEDRYGELHISNDMPISLELKTSPVSPPYKEMNYTYPDAQTSLSGFPAKMVILSRHNKSGDLQPSLEITFLQVKLATQQLPQAYFSESRFMGPEIIYTNVYSNKDVYGMDSKTKEMVKIPDRVVRSLAYSGPDSRKVHTRTAINVCSIIATAVLVILVSVRSSKKLKNKRSV